MKTVTCKLCELWDNTGNGSDMDPRIHDGFSVGKGKKLYWYIVWSKTGMATVYADGRPSGKFTRRTLHPDTEITIHFK